MVQKSPREDVERCRYERELPTRSTKGDEPRCDGHKPGVRTGNHRFMVYSPSCRQSTFLSGWNKNWRQCILKVSRALQDARFFPQSASISWKVGFAHG